MNTHGYTQEHIDSGLITMRDGVPHARVKYLVEEATSCDLDHMSEARGDRRILWRLKANELDAEFCADVVENGIKTPVEFFPPDMADLEGYELGDGHHRVILAYLLGHEFIPVTMLWEESHNGNRPSIKDRL